MVCAGLWRGRHTSRVLTHLTVPKAMVFGWVVNGDWMWNIPGQEASFSDKHCGTGISLENEKPQEVRNGQETERAALMAHIRVALLLLAWPSPIGDGRARRRP